MKNLYKIDKNNPVVELIRQEIHKGYFKENGIEIAIDHLSIDSQSVCTNELYGFHFNVYTMLTPTINVGIYTRAKVDNPPTIIQDNQKGYDYYQSSTNISIKLKNFIERFPQYKEIEEWATPAPKEKCKYHNSSDKVVYIKRPDDKHYLVDIPDGVINGSTEWSNWMNPLEESLTTKFYRDKAFDDLYNIKRGLTFYVDGFWYFYDYFDGVVEIYGVYYIKSNITNKIRNNFDFKKETLELMKKEVESCDLEVKEIKWSDDIYKDRDNIKV